MHKKDGCAQHRGAKRGQNNSCSALRFTSAHFYLLYLQHRQCTVCTYLKARANVIRREMRAGRVEYFR